MQRNDRRTIHQTSPFALLLALMLLVSCGGGDAEPQATADDLNAPPQEGGMLTVGVLSDVANWNPYLVRRSSSAQFVQRIFLSLADPLGDDGQRPQSYSPSIAESWERAEDGLSLTFKLREMNWSDGTALDAEDVRFTWEVQSSTQVPWIGRELKQRIRDVEVLDARTVRFVFDRDYPYQLADAVQGAILPRHRFSEIPFEQWVETDWSQLQIGSGPFLLERHEPGVGATLIRNPHYYRAGRPYVEQLAIRIVRDPSSLVTQLRTGEIDLAIGVAPSAADRLRDDDSLTPLTFEWDYSFVGWNGLRKPFDNVKVRRALALAVDRDALAEELLFGFGRVSNGPVMRSWWGSDPQHYPLPYDVHRAKVLLREAGYAVDDEEGKRLRFTLSTNATNPLRGNAALKIQEQLRQIGVEVDVRQLDSRALQTQVVSGDFDAFLGGWLFAGRVDLHALFHSERIPPNGVNVVRLRSPELNQLLDRVDQVEHWTELQPVYHDIQRRITELQPYMFLYETDRIVVPGRRVRNATVRGNSDPLAAIDEFWLER